MKIRSVLIGFLILLFSGIEAAAAEVPEAGGKSLPAAGALLPSSQKKDWSGEKKKEEEKEGKSLESLGLHFYGHFKLDTSRDTAETNFGNTAFFVKNYRSGEKDEEINMTARHTRLGLNWYGSEIDGIKAFGNIEFDFLGKSIQKNTETQELQPAVRLRHGFMRFDFQGGWSLLAGQTWDAFAPINMKKLNTMVGWGQGNIGFRRPQLRVSKRFAVGGDTDMTAAFALARPVARDLDIDGDSQDDGEDRGVPDLQAHVGLVMPGSSGKPIRIGLGGFVGWREVGENGTTMMSDETYKSYAAVCDFSVPLRKNLDLIGEAWQGRALDGYRAGVWQSYSLLPSGEVRPIDARGAFANLVWKPHRKWRFVAGAGVDDPIDKDLCGGQLGREHCGFIRNGPVTVNAQSFPCKSAFVGQLGIPVPN